MYSSAPAMSRALEELVGHVDRPQRSLLFTHFRLELEIWSATAADPSAMSDGWWADPIELDAGALPTVFRKVLAEALG